jgi:hypothetical protein
MASAANADVQADMAQARFLKPGADTHCHQQIDGALFENSGPNTVNHVLAAAILDDDRVDAVDVQQVPEQEPGRTGTDDSNLRPVETHDSSESVAAGEAAGGVRAAGPLVLCHLEQPSIQLGHRHASQ